MFSSVFLKVFLFLTFLFLLSAVSGEPKPNLRQALKMFQQFPKFDSVFERKIKDQVNHMEIDVQDTEVLSFLDVTIPARQLVSDTFKWSSCGPKDQLVDIHTLTLKPEPLEFPGTLKIGFDVEFKDTIPDTSDLNAKINLDMQEGSGWLHIPCLGSIGSCEYTDLCSKTKEITACPNPFIQAGIPCKCPFQKGEYKLHEMSIEIDAGVFLPGEYRGNVTLTNSKGQLACYNINFAVE